MKINESGKIPEYPKKTETGEGNSSPTGFDSILIGGNEPQIPKKSDFMFKSNPKSDFFSRYITRYSKEDTAKDVGAILEVLQNPPEGAKVNQFTDGYNRVVEKYVTITDGNIQTRYIMDDEGYYLTIQRIDNAITDKNDQSYCQAVAYKKDSDGAYSFYKARSISQNTKQTIATAYYESGSVGIAPYPGVEDNSKIPWEAIINERCKSWPSAESYF